MSFLETKYFYFPPPTCWPWALESYGVSGSQCSKQDSGHESLIRISSALGCLFSQLISESSGASPLFLRGYAMKTHKNLFVRAFFSLCCCQMCKSIHTLWVRASLQSLSFAWRRPEPLEMVKILRQFAQSANEGEIMKSFPLPSIQTWPTLRGMPLKEKAKQSQEQKLFWGRKKIRKKQEEAT